MEDPMTELPAHLADQLCFSLHSASRALTSHYRKRLDALQLTYPQYLTLLALWEEDGRSVRGLGSALHLDSGTLSPLLARLEEAGLISRRNDTEDGRSVRVYLTDRGRALEEQAASVRAEVEERTGLSPGEMVELRERLLQLRQVLEG